MSASPSSTLTLTGAMRCLSLACTLGLLAGAASAQSAPPVATPPAATPSVNASSVNVPSAAPTPAQAAQQSSSSVLSTSLPLSVRSADEPSGPKVLARVAQGLLAGVQDNGANVFLGIPYAQPPVGALRWQAPQPLIPWTGERQAAHYASICPQFTNLLDPDHDDKVYGKEDCLYLNVFAPSSAAPALSAHPTPAGKAPVLLWIHGGSFDSGSANQYNGAELSRRYGVVVVTAEYRLGVLGFLAASGLGEGNYGLQDLQAALRWTQQNAGRFGGDGSNITVFGESAGGMAICNLLAAPSSQGLFQKAIIQSGPCNSGLGSAPLERVTGLGNAYLQGFSCLGPQAGDCMRAKSVNDLLKTPLPGEFIPSQVKLPPTFNSTLIPRDPYETFKKGQSLNVPLLMGSNHDEGTVFTAYLAGSHALASPLYAALVAFLNPDQARRMLRQYPAQGYATPATAAAALVTDGFFACPTDAFASAHAAHSPTYRYEFSDSNAATVLKPTRSIPALGAFHASELAYVFDTSIHGLAEREQFSPQQQQLSERMGEYWTNFARTGNPNGAAINPNGAAMNQALTPWPAYSAAQPQVLSLKPGQNEVVNTFHKAHQCAFWDEVDGRSQ